MKSRLLIGLLLIIGILISSGCSSSSASPTPSAPATGIAGSGNSGGNGGGGGSGGGGGGSGPGDGSGGDVIQPVPSAPPTPSSATGPYLVEQSIKVGDETISGYVCDLSRAFSVNASTPNVQFVISFTPSSGTQGSWVYAYSFPDLGESHAGQGTYSVAEPDSSGTRLLKFTGSDHVVFTGFDGNLPQSYQANLVPEDIPMCDNLP